MILRMKVIGFQKINAQNISVYMNKEKEGAMLAVGLGTQAHFSRWILQSIILLSVLSGVKERTGCTFDSNH
ncbi:hypothetical protein HZS_3497 [Henneguya salminicola]|nr:hypothetical protein HZS_3497 [Henneguya salminicola]